MIGADRNMLEKIVVEFDEAMKAHATNENLAFASTHFAESLKWGESAENCEFKIGLIQANYDLILAPFAADPSFEEL